MNLDRPAQGSRGSGRSSGTESDGACSWTHYDDDVHDNVVGL